MVEQSDASFAGYECVRLDNGIFKLWITRSVGPRIIGLSIGDGRNLFAVVPSAVVTTPAGQQYRLRGGHRLWHAPEDPERTYLPDDAPAAVTPMPDGLKLVQPVEAMTHIEKQMAITLSPDQARVCIDHTLVNRGPWTVELAPWAITQMRTGGFAILPQPWTGTGLLPNRRLALWPYSRADAPELTWGHRYIFFRASMTAGAFKLGWANHPGWLGYWIDDTLFVKKAPYLPGASYFDFGSSSEMYCDPRFLELESLGPRTFVEPGESVNHRELWQVYPGISLEPDEEQVGHLLDRLGIGGIEGC
jgi:hypothetical protein